MKRLFSVYFICLCVFVICVHLPPVSNKVKNDTSQIINSQKIPL